MSRATARGVRRLGALGITLAAIAGCQSAPRAAPAGGVSVADALERASQPGALLAASCSGCHAPPGNVPGAVPAVHGRPAREIHAALLAFRDGSRQGTVMNRIAAGYSREELRLLATHLGAQ